MSAKSFIIYFGLFATIAWSLATSEKVDNCPVGQQRIERQRELCDNATLYHCISDAKCQLHQFCADPQESQPMNTLFIFSGWTQNEPKGNFPSTNTELYGDLSLFFCKYSSRKTFNELFTYILKRLDTNANIINSFKVPCTFPDAEHVLPALDSCEMKFKCAKTRKMVDFKLLVFHNRKLISHGFEMGLSNRTEFYKVGFLLCVLNNEKFYDYKLKPQISPPNKGSVSNSPSDELSIYGIIVGFLVQIIL
ncbi:unnamed protein product [Mytilus coruscus]|uniref:Uncharacterized protein n=1 Tax=Mytilus coruscus TaxID=42192 RepID=A0A6J8F1K6_MYTCO|nr:unnamed protein product [Mytilus coruscus]